MDDKLKEAMDNLYHAKWNIPKAAVHLGFANREQGWEQVKVMFTEYCNDLEMGVQGIEP